MPNRSFTSACLFSLSLALGLFSLVSCGSGDSSSTETDTTAIRSDTMGGGAAAASRAGAAPFVTYDELRILYVENNPANTQLGKLLENGNKRKLVFQIFRDRSGDLRLLVIPSRGSSGYYFLNDTIQPKLSDITQTAFPSDKNVVLGDLQLAGAPLQTLRDSIGNPDNHPNWRYILFVPEIKEVEDDQTPRTMFKHNYLIYHIKYADGLPTGPIRDLSSTKIGTLELRSLTEANPTPPRRLQ